MENQLKNSNRIETNQRFRNLFEYISVGMVICNTDGFFTDINKPFCELTGYSKEELQTMNCKDITHPDDLQLDQAKVKLLLERQIDHYEIEKRYIRKDKTVIWVKLTVSVIPDDIDSPTSLIGTIEDITEMVKPKERLLMTQFGIDNAQIGIYQIDEQGNIY